MFFFCMDYWWERKEKINAYQFMREAEVSHLYRETRLGAMDVSRD